MMKIEIMTHSKILIIEDTDVFAIDLQNKFINWGYSSTNIASSQQALQKANKMKPNLILLDFKLKYENSVNLAQKIIDNFDTAIVYIIDFINNENMKLIRTTKPYGYITKTFEENQLKYTIEDAIYRHKIYQQYTLSK